MTWAKNDYLLITLATQILSGSESAKIEINLRQNMDWDNLVIRASEEGLTSFLYRHCSDLGLLSLLPEWVREDLQHSYQQTVYQNLYLLRFIEELGETLKKHNLPVIVLKGASLLNIVYSDIGLRPMEDIDLMVHKKDLGALDLVLKKMGFERNKLYSTTYRRGIICVDLHTDFISSHRIKSRLSLIRINYEEIWERAVPLIGEEIPVYRLSLYDNLMALSYHLLKHSFNRLIWFVDIKESINRYDTEFDWLSFAESSQKAGANRIVLYIMILTKHILGLRVPDDALQRFGLKHLSMIEKQILRIRLANEPMGRLSQLLYLFQIKKMSQRFKFICENIFPKKEVMKQIFPYADQRLSPDLYILRGLNIFLNGVIDVFVGARAVCKKSLPRI